MSKIKKEYSCALLLANDWWKMETENFMAH